MKKFVIALGMLALLLVGPASSFAAEAKALPEKQPIVVASDSVYVSGISNYYTSLSAVPSTYYYVTPIGNKVYAGTLSLSYVNSTGPNSYYAYYAGTLTFTGLVLSK
ncbi:hypothetical protein [Gorillibacterium sp. CAU 1737]|uniref:hypothetical protein n=1 Tax=Gorillibacterium sp. CAU 1737 TaxID=3140362 RepID=UPI003260E0C6